MQLLTDGDFNHMIESLRSTIVALEGALAMGLVEESEGVFIHKPCTVEWFPHTPNTKERIEEFRARLTRLEATKEYLSRVEFAEPDEIETARNTYCWDDESGIQIDNDARVSRGDPESNITWIGAWVLIGGRGPGE